VTNFAWEPPSLPNVVSGAPTYKLPLVVTLLENVAAPSPLILKYSVPPPWFDTKNDLSLELVPAYTVTP